MVYDKILITFCDDEDVETVTFHKATFRVQGGILFIHKENDSQSLEENSPVFTIKEERIHLLSVRAKI